jgi:hypothetical protein
VANVSAWSPSGFRALGGGLNAEVRALVASQGVVFAGGTFGRSGSVSVPGLGVWNGTNWSSVPGWSRTGILSLAIAPDGAMLVGGNFTTPTSNGTANNLAELRSGVWRALGSSVSGTVNSVAAWKSEWVLGGAFGFAGSIPSYAFARWTTTGAPALSIVPRSRYATCGEDLRLSVEVAAGYSGSTFRWLRNAQEIDTASVPSAATASLLLGSIGPDSDGVYECVVTNACGSVVTAATIASDCCPADLDDDALVGDVDFGLFTTAYDAVDCQSPSMLPLCPSDLNRDGMVDDVDFQIFAIAYDRLECAG